MTTIDLDKNRAEAARKLILALDFASAKEARHLVAALHGKIGFFKIGLELICADGLPLARTLIESGYRVFLDTKLLDIPATVEHATANAARLGATFLTVHGIDRKTLDAAVKGRGESTTQLLAVTVLTSADASDLVDQGIAMDPAELVLRRARLAKQSGFDGVIASAREAETIRAELGDGFLIVTPGIRPAGAAAADQKRIATPAGAIAAGADYLVVGRAITAAADPHAAVEAIIDEVEAALQVQRGYA